MNRLGIDSVVRFKISDLIFTLLDLCPGIRLVSVQRNEFLSSLFLFQCRKHGAQNVIHEPCHGHLSEFPQAVKPRNEFFIDLRAVHWSREWLLGNLP